MEAVSRAVGAIAGVLRPSVHESNYGLREAVVDSVPELGLVVRGWCFLRAFLRHCYLVWCRGVQVASCGKGVIDVSTRVEGAEAYAVRGAGVESRRKGVKDVSLVQDITCWVVLGVRASGRVIPRAGRVNRRVICLAGAANCFVRRRVAIPLSTPGGLLVIEVLLQAASVGVAKVTAALSARTGFRRNFAQLATVLRMLLTVGRGNFLGLAVIRASTAFFKVSGGSWP